MVGNRQKHLDQKIGAFIFFFSFFFATDALYYIDLEEQSEFDIMSL